MQTILNRPGRALQFAAALFPLVAFAGSAQATDRIYTLVPYLFDDSRFGFSGTITTDGSIGSFSDASFIKDWSITVETASDVDGIATEVFTPATGSSLYVNARAADCVCLQVTDSYIQISSSVVPWPGPNVHPAMWLSGPGDDPTSVQWAGDAVLFPTPLGGASHQPDYVAIFDASEWPGIWRASRASSRVADFGVPIPEPSGLFLLSCALAAILAPRRPSLLRSRVKQVAAAVFLFVASAGLAQADIFQWEYINPADPSQGKQQSTTLAPDGAGVDAVPGADLSNRNLTMAYLIGADLTNASGYLTTLNNADLRQANLTNAYFAGAQLSNANLSHANLRDSRFGVAFVDCQDICYAFTALANANFTNADLRGANFVSATLLGADFTGASVQGADFTKLNFFNPWWNVITLAQLYSTASYQVQDLSGIKLEGFFDGADFAGQNLTNADLSTATLTDADFTGADARGAFGLNYYISNPSGTTTVNLIWSNGHIIYGLNLDAGGLLVVRDYDGGSQYVAAGQRIPISVDQHLTMGPGGTLRMVFEADAWDSTISFAPGIPVTLGGTLELTFADDVNLASQVGRTFDVFDWTGVTPIGAFAISSPYRWDRLNLYTSGEVTLIAIPEPGSIALVAAAAFCGRRLRSKIGRGGRRFRVASRSDGWHAFAAQRRRHDFAPGMLTPLSRREHGTHHRSID